MQTANTQLILASDSVFPMTTKPFHIGGMSILAVQIAIISGSFDILIQGSCDEGASGTTGDTQPNVKNWTDIKGSFQSVIAGDDLMYDLDDMGYKWLRLSVLGSGSLTARINSKGG